MADNTEDATKGTVGVNDAPVPPQVIVQMMTPQAAEPTEGMSETARGGDYFVHKPDGKGRLVKTRVDAEGRPYKGK